MEIAVRACNNIDEAKFSIKPGHLNIKYGPNGTGKSTIARALLLSGEGKSALQELQPFKYRVVDGAPDPAVEGTKKLKTVLIFNEEYLDQFVFQRDELLKDSYQIFIKTPEYDEKMKEIDALVAAIQDAFKKNEAIDQVLEDLVALSESFGKSQSGWAKSGKFAKALADGNKVDNIPPKLADYSSFIASDSGPAWIKWQTDGNQFLELSAKCPYCTAPTDERKDTILAVEQEYDAKAIEHLLAIKMVVERLGKYFSAETLSKIQQIVKGKTSPKKEQIEYLVRVRRQIETLREKLLEARQLSFFSFQQVEKVQQHIGHLKIDMSFLDSLQSEASSGIVDDVNACLDKILKQAGQLEGEVNKQKKAIEKAIKKHNNEINTFLRNAGYKYTVDIELDELEYKMKLKHDDFNSHIEDSAHHLSFGERNAFSLVLFMYDCLTKKPDLVVLDDPISSFDDTKKFAVLEVLFRGKDSFQGQTVLMLTHDIEPVIDLMKTLRSSFQPTPVASFLHLRAGQVREIPIEPDDIVTFTRICQENVQKLSEVVVKLIYLRRHYEIVDDKGAAYQLLANLLHRRAVPIFRDAQGERPMSAAEIAAGTTNIKQLFPGFDYESAANRLADQPAMLALYKATQNRYERLQLFRIVSPGQADNPVLRKFINESFHIENEYIMQLNPHKFDAVPEHIISECDRLLGI